MQLIRCVNLTNETAMVLRFCFVESAHDNLYSEQPTQKEAVLCHQGLTLILSFLCHNSIEGVNWLECINNFEHMYEMFSSTHL